MAPDLSLADWLKKTRVQLSATWKRPHFDSLSSSSYDVLWGFGRLRFFVEQSTSPVRDLLVAGIFISIWIDCAVRDLLVGYSTSRSREGSSSLIPGRPIFTFLINPRARHVDAQGTFRHGSMRFSDHIWHSTSLILEADLCTFSSECQIWRSK